MKLVTGLMVKLRFASYAGLHNLFPTENTLKLNRIEIEQIWTTAHHAFGCVHVEVFECCISLAFIGCKGLSCKVTVKILVSYETRLPRASM